MLTGTQAETHQEEFPTELQIGECKPAFRCREAHFRSAVTDFRDTPLGGHSCGDQIRLVHYGKDEPEIALLPVDAAAGSCMSCI